MANFTVADRVGGIGGYIGGISAILGMLGGAMPVANGGNVARHFSKCGCEHLFAAI